MPLENYGLPRQPDLGWLWPDGSFHVCEFGRHARLPLRYSLSERDAEDAGWWKLAATIGERELVWSGTLDATPEQRRFISQWFREREGRRPDPAIFKPEACGKPYWQY